MYQIRLSVNDIELFTKEVDDKFYVKVNVETCEELSDIDYTSGGKMKWEEECSRRMINVQSVFIC